MKINSLIVAVCMAACMLTGCSSPKEEPVTPIPAPVVNYDDAIIGRWETIESKNYSPTIGFEFYPNKTCILFNKINSQWIESDTKVTYQIIDNKKLVLKTDEIENTFYITITGNVMIISIGRETSLKERYVVVLWLKRVISERKQK